MQLSAARSKSRNAQRYKITDKSSSSLHVTRGKPVVNNGWYMNNTFNISLSQLFLFFLQFLDRTKKLLLATLLQSVRHKRNCNSGNNVIIVDCVWNVMAHAQKPHFVFRRNGRVHLNRRGASVQSTTGSRGVHISGSNAGYTMFPGSVKGTGYPPHSLVSHSLPLPCVTVCHHISTGLYYCVMGFSAYETFCILLMTSACYHLPWIWRA